MKSRYIPLTQQSYCCVPTSLQMVMYRHNIPLIAQEDLAYALGLIVPKEDVRLFDKVRTGKKPSSGWGTQIQDPEFEINKVIKSLDIPLHFDVRSDIASVEELEAVLTQVAKDDGDALLCFDYGKLWDLDSRGGHVCVFDWLDGDGVWLVDPERNVPKHRKTTLERLFRAIDFHGPENAAGVWIVSRPG